MPTNRVNGMSDVIRHLRKISLRCGGGGLSDRQLLECFLADRDEAAFEELVRRHGPMVLGVCRRVLGNHHDAEDAFQATFLVLARKGASLRARELVGNWLYGVAYRTALRAKAMIARRHKHEQRARELARPEPPADDGWQEMLPVLDRELNGLPERYRVALVLCDLQGVTHRQAARQLGLPEGTLSGRLTTARRLLARRLSRYGLAPSAGAVAMILAETTASAHVPSSLAASTARAAVRVATGLLTAGTVPAQVVALTEGVINTMLLTKLKSFVALALVLVVGAGVVGLTQGQGAGPAEPGPARAVEGARPLADDLEALRLEVEALRKALQATRERVKSLEAEVQTLRRPGGAAPASKGQRPENVTRPGAIRRMADDPVVQAEAALQAVREARDAEARRRAADALEKALKRLKEQQQPNRAMPH